LLSVRGNSFLQPFLHDELNNHRVFLWHLAQARRTAPPGLMEVADLIMDTVDREIRIAGKNSGSGSFPYDCCWPYQVDLFGH
jgi:hypothetical protein